MSKEINNHEYRQKVIREMLNDLHQGKSVDEVKNKFEEAFSGVSASEISEAEQALIDGGIAVEEVQQLCDIHAAVFKDSLKKAVAKKDPIVETKNIDPSTIPGHPIHTMKEENRALEKLIEKTKKVFLLYQENELSELIKNLESLMNINIHYQRKENLIFPYMEKHGITAPPKVMWGVDDEIRAELKQVLNLIKNNSSNKKELEELLNNTLNKITEMIFKEENILFPLLLDTLTNTEWKVIADESDEIGYFLISPPPSWTPIENNEQHVNLGSSINSGSIKLPTGILELNELRWMLNFMPVDITFVDKNDIVKYFSQGSERIFPRTKTIIGRNVSNCHPPASVHIVEGILNDFKSGKKTHEDFWIKMGDKYIYIRYFAVRDENNEYLGTLEVTQNIKPIQEITEEKRLVE